MAFNSRKLAVFVAMWSVVCAVASGPCSGQERFTGPKPAKTDLPYLMHADTLVETEVGVAQEQQQKDVTLYVVPGATSPVKTPLSSPIFIIDASKLDAGRLQLFRLESKNGHREIAFRKKGKGGPAPLRMTATHVQDNLWKLETAVSLPNGEYSLTIEGANDVFSFAVY